MKLKATKLEKIFIIVSQIAISNYSIDKAGNQEGQKSIGFNIDKTKPSTPGLQVEDPDVGDVLKISATSSADESLFSNNSLKDNIYNLLDIKGEYYC